MIYMDNAATSKMTWEVLQGMRPYFSGQYGNPSSSHFMGRTAKEAMEEARQAVAELIHANREEIVFTSGGTEADNLALQSMTKGRKTGIITQATEHHAVLHTCGQLRLQGAEVSVLPVDSQGCISMEQLENSLTNNTAGVSIMYANNEIGTLQPVEEIGKICKKYDLLFHCDAVQAVGHLPLDVRKINAHFLSASAHKFGGPKGVGFLYVKEGRGLLPMMQGGSQEKGLRPGTGNVSGVVGMGIAARKCMREMEAKEIYLRRLRDYMETQIVQRIPEVKINGARENRLPGNLNLSIKNVEGEALLYLLDERGVCVSAGSACNAAKKEESHVIRAIGVDGAYARGTLRFSLGGENTKAEVDYVVQTLAFMVEQLRNA